MNQTYNGAQHQLTTAPSPAFNTGGVTERNQQGAARALHNLTGLGEQMIRLEDFSTQQADEATLNQKAREFDIEVENRLMLPDGHSDSFFESNGTLRQRKVDSLTQKYRKDFEGLGTHIIEPEARQRMQSRAQNAVDSMGAALFSRGAKEAQRKAMANYQNNQALALERGDYATALNANQAAVAAGLIPQSEADLKNHRIAKQSARSRMATRRSRGRGYGRSAARQGARQNTLDLYSALVSDKAGSDTTSGAPITTEQTTPTAIKPPSKEKTESTHTLPTEDISVDSGQLTLPTALPDLDKTSQSESALRAGYDEELFFQDGIAQFDDDEYSLQITESAAVSGSPALVNNTETGGRSLDIPASTPEPLEETIVRANTAEGLTKDRLRSMTIAAGNYYATSEDYENLSDSDIERLILTQMDIEGVSEALFDGDEARMESFLQGSIQPILSLRGGDIGKNDRAMTGAEGLKGINQLVEEVFDSDTWLGDWRYRQDLLTDETSWGEWSHKNENVKQSFIRNRGRFNEETGNEYEVIDDAYDAYYEWYMKKGGRWEEERDERRAQIKEIAKLRAIDAVAQYRAKGGKSWAEEQRLIRQALTRASGEAHSQETPVADYYAQQKKTRREQAAKYRQEAAATIRYLSSRKQKATSPKAAPKSAAVKKTAAQLEEEERKEYPYRYPIKQSMAWDRNKGETSREPIITVPYEQYAEICEQLGVTEDSGRGIGAKIDRGRTLYIVRPGRVSGVQISEAIFSKITPKGLTKSQLKKRLENLDAQLTYQSF